MTLLGRVSLVALQNDVVLAARTSDLAPSQTLMTTGHRFTIKPLISSDDSALASPPSASNKVIFLSI